MNLHSHSFAITPSGPSSDRYHHDGSSSVIGLRRNSNGYGGGTIEYNPSPILDMDHFFDDDTARSLARKRRSSIEGNGSIQGSNSRMLLYTDSFQQFVGPLASFGNMFGSLSNNSSTDQKDNYPVTVNTTTADGATPDQNNNQGHEGQTTSTKRCSPTPIAARTVALTPRNRLPSPSQRSCTLFTDSTNISAADPSRGTLEHYDNELYNQLKTSTPPPSQESSKQASLLQPLLVSHTTTQPGNNQLVILRGSKQTHSSYEIDDCASSFRTYEFYKFLREIYPALERCTYLLPGLLNHGDSKRKSGQSLLLMNTPPDDEDEEEDGIAINVSRYGSFKLGHVPGMTKLEKVCYLFVSPSVTLCVWLTLYSLCLVF